MNELNALALEYQGQYGTAFRNVDIADLINNTDASGVGRILRSGFEKQRTDLVFSEEGSFLQDVSDPLLIGFDRG